jgi:uncharacterized damage-inducible protein DinB
VDKAALTDLFDFTGYAWKQIRQAVPGDADLRRVAPGSGWPALRDCLGHMVLAYDRWLPAIVDLKTQDLPELPADDLRTWAEIEAQRARVRDELARWLAGWSEPELAAVHDVDVDGATLRYSRGELVTHLLLHERGHHGDVTTLFWQLGIDAETALEYRFHLGRG